MRETFLVSLLQTPSISHSVVSAEIAKKNCTQNPSSWQAATETCDKSLMPMASLVEWNVTSVAA